MVSTNSFGENDDFVVGELLDSPLPGDAEVAQKAELVILRLLSDLRPILKYIAYPLVGKTRGIIVTQPGEVRANWINAVESPALILTEDSKWGYLSDFNTPKAKLVLMDEAWMRAPFSTIVGGLLVSVYKGLEKRKRHMDALEKRQKILNQIMELIR